jgi:hypothetical protein
MLAEPYLTLNIIILFKGFSKLLICGGYNPDGPDYNNCEVINLASSSTTCKNPPNFPAKVSSAIGGLGLKGNPIICGGLQNGSMSNKCYSLENNDWVSSASMNSVRVDAAAAQLQNGKLLVTGGFYSSGSYLNRAEMLTEEGWESNIPSLPVTIAAHCMVTVNSTTVLIIGGMQNNQFSGKTFYFTFGEESWTEGPKLKYRRAHHSCGKIRRNKVSQEISIIVAGVFLSVEILDEGSNEWRTGPELPFGISSSQMVEDQNGGVVLIGGSLSSVGYLDTLYKLPHAGRDAVWTKMQQKLKTGIGRQTAFLVPDNIVECSQLHKNSSSGKKIIICFLISPFEEKFFNWTIQLLHLKASFLKMYSFLKSKYCLPHRLSEFTVYLHFLCYHETWLVMERWNYSAILILLKK